MPRYQILIKAEEMNNVASLVPCNLDDFEWNFKFVCTKCRELHDQIVTVISSQSVEKARVSTNLLMKCKFCASQGSVDLDGSTLKPYTHEDVPAYKQLICLECRGWEPVEFILGDGWKAKALNSDQTMDNFSLEDNEWVDYDEISGQPMEVFGIETKVERG